MIEILAPAGDLISLKSAIASDTDAVYLGLSAFNARIKAENFTTENIKDTVDYCHLFGVKVYVTINIAVKESEKEELKKIIVACGQANVDAFIITDMLALELAKEFAPNVRLHASTQFGVCNAEGAKFAESLGFSRVVLSREATIEEIKKIKAETNLEIEYFVHGALCVAFSGKCLMSSFINGGSGNRGRCLQPCRLFYTEKTTGKQGYLLSTSDLCLAENLKELAAAGVSSFKIEGRLRRPEYVFKTVSTYKKIVKNGFIAQKNDINALKSAYNRGNFTKGYSFDDTKNIMSEKVQGNIGLLVGKVASVDKQGYAEISFFDKISEGQGYKLLDENGFEKSGGAFPKAKNGKYPIIGAKPGYEIRKTSDSEFTFSEKKIPVKVKYLIDENGKFSATYEHKEFSYTVSADFEKAQNKPLDEMTITDSLSKTGDTCFVVEKVSGKILSDVFAQRSVLNSLRRDALDGLKEEILKSYKFAKNDEKPRETIIKNRKNYNNLIAIEVQNENQLSRRIINEADAIVFFPDEFSEKSVSLFLSFLGDKKDKAYLKLTVNARENDVDLYESIIKNTGISGIYATNPYGIYLARKYNLKLFSGYELNIYNEVDKNLLSDDLFVASAELTEKELKTFSTTPFVFAYGYLPLMNLSHCASQLLTGKTCKNCAYKNGFTYADRKNYEFKILRNKAANCYFTLYNSKIHDISSKVKSNSFNLYLNMLQLSRDEVDCVFAAFKDNLSLTTRDKTNGHFINGVL